MLNVDFFRLYVWFSDKIYDPLSNIQIMKIPCCHGKKKSLHISSKTLYTLYILYTLLSVLLYIHIPPIYQRSNSIHYTHTWEYELGVCRPIWVKTRRISIQIWNFVLTRKDALKWANFFGKLHIKIQTGLSRCGIPALNSRSIHIVHINKYNVNVTQCII